MACKATLSTLSTLHDDAMLGPAPNYVRTCTRTCIAAMARRVGDSGPCDSGPCGLRASSSDKEM